MLLRSSREVQYYKVSLNGPHFVTRSWLKPLSFQENLKAWGHQPKYAAHHFSPRSVPKSGRWVPSTFQNSVIITYHIGTGSTVCSLLPFPHICLQPSACHCRSLQIQLHLTPPRTCTPAHYYKMLHSVMGSCKPRRWHIIFIAHSSPYRLLGANHFCAWPPAIYCIAEGFPPETLNLECQEQLLFTDNRNCQELLEP